MLHSTLLFLSPGDITLILVAALVMFGGKKLPELARGLGTGIKEFKEATSGVTAENNAPKPVVVEQPAPTVEQQQHA
jgi:sec-independent protein translocase protein TatA